MQEDYAVFGVQQDQIEDDRGEGLEKPSPELELKCSFSPFAL